MYVAEEDWSKEMNIDYFEEIQYPYLGLLKRRTRFLQKHLNKLKALISFQKMFIVFANLGPVRDIILIMGLKSLIIVPDILSSLTFKRILLVFHDTTSHDPILVFLLQFLGSPACNDTIFYTPALFWVGPGGAGIWKDGFMALPEVWQLAGRVVEDVTRTV